MSQLVEDNFFTNFQSDFSELPDPQPYRDQFLDGLKLLIQRANTEGFNLKIHQTLSQQSQRILKIIAHVKYSSTIFDFVIEITVDMRNKKIQCRTSFLDDEQYFCTRSTLKRKILCRKILKINIQLDREGLKLIQDMQNGKIVLLTVVQESQSLFNSRETIWAKMKATLKKICEVCSNCSMEILQICDRERFKKFHLKNGGDQLKKIKKQQFSYAKLIKQLQVSHVHFGFSCKADESSFPTLQKSQEQQLKLRQFLINSSYDDFQSSSRRLFLCNFQQYLDAPIHSISYEMQHNQAKTYSSYLKSPVPRDPNPGENKFIFNHIEIIKPQAVKFRETSLQGGQNKIMVAKASFYYCESSSLERLKFSQNSMGVSSVFNSNNLNTRSNQEARSRNGNLILTKMVAVKVPKKKQPQKNDQKYENQKNIIRSIKSGVSAYILKYYVSKQPNFQFRDCLLIDFLPNSQPLSNYIEIFKETLSLNSKAYIIVNLANSIRFLNDYQIVHMDLNLNNFLVYRDYLTKLIDFGEAYSPNIHKSCSSNFKRGYTFPFCSPEYFQRKSNFTNKQDVFSLGMIIWRMIFNDYPFFTSSQALKSYKNNTYLNKIMLAPQRGNAYGNVQTVDFLYRLLFKCLSPNELQRCQPSWLTIFFKIIYFYFL